MNYRLQIYHTILYNGNASGPVGIMHFDKKQPETSVKNTPVQGNRSISVSCAIFLNKYFITKLEVIT